MARSRVVAMVALAASLMAVSSAFAQPPGLARQGRIVDKGDRDVQTCPGAAGGSRMRDNCAAEVTIAPLRTQQEFKVPVEVQAEAGAPLCEVAILTEYLQRNTVARVNGSLAIKNCPMGSTGEYSLVLRIKDANGDVKPVEFRETWRSGDARDVKTTADYPIGNNVELLNVRVRGLRCTCAEAAPAPTEISVSAGED